MIRLKLRSEAVSGENLGKEIELELGLRLGEGRGVKGVRFRIRIRIEVRGKERSAQYRQMVSHLLSNPNPNHIFYLHPLPVV
jgi:phosphoribosylformylglycinamidine (FGAM) synthase PurS component